MSKLSYLLSAIAQVDAEARQLVATAAAEGDFDDVIQLTPVAKEVAELVARWPLGSVPTPTRSVGSGDTDEKGANNRASSNGSNHLVSPKKNQYPQFVRERDDLVKLGWSSREKKTYEHRVPKGALDLITRTVASKGKTGQRFSMDELLAAIETRSSGDDVPSYQAYAAVSWLKQNGMLLQHGRQGYTVVRPQTFADSVQTAWQALKRR